MSVVVGSGDYVYETLPRWGVLPEGWALGDVAGIGIDRQDRVYCFNRGNHPMIVFDRDGNFLSSWGEGVFKHPHAVHVGPDETLYCTDDGDHTVRKCALDGRVLLEIGIPGRPSGYMSGEPFNRCTHTALSPRGDIYVSDGYGNACVHKYDPAGRRLSSWGAPGADRGQFNIPHNICCDADGWVYVADRENHRIQVFDGDGKYETQWNNLHRPSGLFMTAGKCPICYVGEIGPYMDVNRHVPNLGPRVSILDHKGQLLGRLAREPSAGVEPGRFLSPHGLAVDSHGDLYVGEVAAAAWPSLFPGVPAPDPLRRMQKFVRRAAASAQA
jgi:DNA-binding beta-propeller fold protein YncE